MEQQTQAGMGAALDEHALHVLRKWLEARAWRIVSSADFALSYRATNAALAQWFAWAPFQPVTASRLITGPTEAAIVVSAVRLEIEDRGATPPDTRKPASAIY